MNQAQRIRMAAAYKGVTLSSIADALGISIQNFSQRIDRGSLNEDEIRCVAETLGAESHTFFKFPDGTII